MGNSLGAGSAIDLDFYPYEKPKFKDNVMPSEVRALYINSAAVRKIEEYIDFETVPRYTPNGRRWRSVTTTDCIYSDPHYGDCGTCPFLQKEKPTDLIGVCFNECLRLQANATDE